jgi:hypothetical protein
MSHRPLSVLLETKHACLGSGQYALPGRGHACHSRRAVLDPDLAAVLLAAAFAGVLALPGLRRALRRGERFCQQCGRRILLGERTCDCDF